MNHIQDAVCAFLEEQTKIRTVRAGEHRAGKYPAFAVGIREEGTVLTAGGKQAEHSYLVTVTAAPDRERTGETAALAALVPVLLRGIPLTVPATKQSGAVRRVLSPLGIETEGDTLRFTLRLSAPIPSEQGGGEAADTMQVLHFEA